MMDIPPEGIPLSDIVNRPLPHRGDEPFNVLEQVELTNDSPDFPPPGPVAAAVGEMWAEYGPKSTANEAQPEPSYPDITGRRFEVQVLHELGSLSARLDAVLTGQLVSDEKLNFIGSSMQWLTQTFTGIQQAAMNMPGLMGGMVRKMTTGGK